MSTHLTGNRSRAGDTTVAPDFSAVTGSGVDDLIGALLTLALVTAVAALLASAIAWALAAASGNWMTVARARTGVLVSLGGAVLTGAGLAWTNWLLATGEQL